MSETTAGLHGIPLEPHATKEAVFRAARSAGLEPEYDVYFLDSESGPTTGVYEDADPPASGPFRIERIRRFADRLARARLAKLAILPIQGSDEDGPVSAYMVIVPGAGAECVDSTAVLSLSHHPAPGVHTATISILSDGRLAVLEMPALKRMFDTLRRANTARTGASAQRRKSRAARRPA